jgi:predicted dienelactone hydrolase
MVRIFLFLVLAFSQPLLAMHRSTERASLGVRTIDYLDASRNRPVVIELWYPTAAHLPVDVPSDSIWVHPKEVRNAPLFKGKAKFPLILISHGHRGGRREASWLAASLVQAGYMVAAVDHYGDMRFHSDIFESIRFWNRPLDFTFVLDQLEKDGSLQAEIDFNRIGFIGYSMGGMTGLALAGGQAQNGRVRQAALKLTQSALHEKLIDRFDLSCAEKSYKDPRIKAMVLLCPAVFIYAPDTLKQIKTPIGLVAALGDEVLPFKEHAYQIIHYLVPKKLKMLREEISHYAFLNPLTDSGKLILHKALQNDPPCCGRDTLHREVTAFAIEFFQATLKKRKG